MISISTQFFVGKTVIEILHEYSFDFVLKKDTISFDRCDNNYGLLILNDNTSFCR